MLGNAQQKGCGGDRCHNLGQRGTIEGTEPRPDDGAKGDTTPNAAAHIAERFSAAVDASDFDSPCRRPSVEAGFTKALENAAKVGYCKSQRQKVGSA